MVDREKERERIKIPVCLKSNYSFSKKYSKVFFRTLNVFLLYSCVIIVLFYREITVQPKVKKFIKGSFLELIQSYLALLTLIHRAQVIYGLHLLDRCLARVKMHEKQILQVNFEPGKNLAKKPILEIYFYHNFGVIRYQAML